jgi:two-component system, NtrC family, response regulator HydG
MEDLPILAGIMVERLAPELRMRPPKLTDRAIAKLEAYSWPGNIRELRNVLERAMLVSDGHEIRVEDLIMPDTAKVRVGGSPAPTTESEIQPLEEIVSSYVRAAVDAAGGNVRKAARLLEISPSTLYARLRKTPESDE